MVIAHLDQMPQRKWPSLETTRAIMTAVGIIARVSIIRLAPVKRGECPLTTWK
jgi:hypothetical protein